MSLRQSGTEKVIAFTNAVTGLITSHNNNSNAHSTEMAKKVNNTDSRLSDKREPKVTIIDVGGDLNNYKEAGLYYIPVDLIDYMNHLPIESLYYSHILLFVESNNDEGIGINVKQTISYDEESYIRYYYSNEWSTWINVRTPKTHNHTKSEITDFPSTMTPSSHGHGSISDDGRLGIYSNKPLITTTQGKITTGSFGTSAYTFCQGNDSRLSDARTPTAHTNATASSIGQATNSVFGHTKISDSYTLSDGSASQGISASSKAVYDCYTTLDAKKNNRYSLYYGNSSSNNPTYEVYYRENRLEIKQSTPIKIYAWMNGENICNTANTSDVYFKILLGDVVYMKEFDATDKCGKMTINWSPGTTANAQVYVYWSKMFIASDIIPITVVSSYSGSGGTGIQ